MIVLFASAVPDSNTWFVLTTGSLTKTGAAGATVSTVTDNGEEAALVTPETVSVAFSTCIASVKTEVM